MLSLPQFVYTCTCRCIWLWVHVCGGINAILRARDKLSSSTHVCVWGCLRITISILSVTSQRLHSFLTSKFSLTAILSLFLSPSFSPPTHTCTHPCVLTSHKHIIMRTRTYAHVRQPRYEWEGLLHSWLLSEMNIMAPVHIRLSLSRHVQGTHVIPLRKSRTVDSWKLFQKANQLICS